MVGEITQSMLPVVTLKLNAGEQVFTESGGMSWMDDAFKMETSTNGGIGVGIGRMLAGESLFMNIYTAEKDDAEIAFASSFPGEVLHFDLQEGQEIIAQKKAFMVGEKTVQMKMHFNKKFGAGLFGGEGFIMQKITGPGKVYLECDGNLVKKEIKQGEPLKVDNGYIVAMTSGVNIDIQMVKGIKNVFFGGEGLFLTTLSGEGTVWLQSMPICKLAGAIQPYVYTGK